MLPQAATKLLAPSTPMAGDLWSPLEVELIAISVPTGRPPAAKRWPKIPKPEVSWRKLSHRMPKFPQRSAPRAGWLCPLTTKVLAIVSFPSFAPDGSKRW